MRYAAAGKLQKTPIAASAPQQKKGIRGKVAENRGEELKEYMGSVVKLVEEYVPPVPADIQAAFQAGKLMVGKDAAGASVIEAGVGARYFVSSRVGIDGGYGISSITVDIAPTSSRDRSASGRIEYSLQHLRLGLVYVP